MYVHGRTPMWTDRYKSGLCTDGLHQTRTLYMTYLFFWIGVSIISRSTRKPFLFACTKRNYYVRSPHKGECMIVI